MKLKVKIFPAGSPTPVYGQLIEDIIYPVMFEIPGLLLEVIKARLSGITDSVIFAPDFNHVDPKTNRISWRVMRKEYMGKLMNPPMYKILHIKIYINAE